MLDVFHEDFFLIRRRKPAFRPEGSVAVNSAAADGTVSVRRTDFFFDPKRFAHIHSISVLYPKVSEVWMCYWGKNIGYEENGSEVSFLRPAMIVKKFNNEM